MFKQVQSSSSTPFCFNPAPKKSETMKEKIRIFNSSSTGPEIRTEHLSACDDKTEIKTGLVSEIIASFSMIANENTRKKQVF